MSDDDARFRNRFRDGENDEPMKRKTKRVYNRATGQFQDAAPRVHPEGAAGWYKDKLGLKGQRRKRKIDNEVEKATD